MNQELLKKLSVITAEEQEILHGRNTVDRSLYYRDTDLSKKNEIDASLLLEKGKLIDIRPSTRFIHFPEHTHNFVELVYMCNGSTRHIIDGHEICLHTGDLLFMNQFARQEIYPAGKDDIAVNFIIMPQFFDTVLKNIGESSDALRDFLISCLTDRLIGSSYLYFHASGILPVENLMDNMIWSMLNSQKNSRTIMQETMALLFLNLMNYTDRIHLSGKSFEQDTILQLLNYIDEEYKDASLNSFSKHTGIDIYTLSRMLKKATGKTFMELLNERRMSQAAYLLKNSKLSVNDISLSIGYENTSWFHRQFLKTYDCTPRQYRTAYQKDQSDVTDL